MILFIRGEFMQTVFIASSSFNWLYIIYLLAMILPWALVPIMAKENKKKNLSKKQKKIANSIIMGFCSLFSFVLLLVILFTGLRELNTYKNTLYKYNHGEYKEVEGYISGFKMLADNEGRTMDEEFYVDDVFFRVYASEIGAKWYSPKSNGNGIIYKDGQYVKVKYNISKGHNHKDRNYIMQIDILNNN